MAIGRDPPPLDVPTLDGGDEIIWRRWHVMHAGRRYVGMGGSPTPLDPDRIAAWAERLGMDPDDATALMQTMDAVLFEHATPDPTA